MPNNFPFNKNSFTLVEILVVVSILAILAAATMPSLIGYASERSVARVAQLVKADIELVRNKSLSGALYTPAEGDWAIQFTCGSPDYKLGIRNNSNSFISIDSKSLPAFFTIRWVPCSSGNTITFVFERLTGKLISLTGADFPSGSSSVVLYYRYGESATQKSSTFTIYQNGKINVQ